MDKEEYKNLVNKLKKAEEEYNMLMQKFNNLKERKVNSNSIKYKELSQSFELLKNKIILINSKLESL
ncbi:MAG: hypothetical protein ACI4T8_00850 [Christensenellales bacterium]